MSHVIAEVERALRDFLIPATPEEWTAAYVPPDDREQVELLERERLKLSAEVLQGNLPYDMTRVFIYSGFDNRVIVYIFTATDTERDAIFLDMSVIKKKVYEVLSEFSLFEDRKTKLKIVLDSKETVDRDFEGSFSLRARAD